MEIQVIAHASNGYIDKFGIPRQSSEESVVETRIVFTHTYRVREALRGIEGYSHLWLIWGFSQVPEGTWSPTVRPPRLGGNKRMGVFATRSPYRPNRLGLSSVRLLRVEQTPTDGCVLVVSGADLMNGTPIYDIKPYLTFSDSHPNAVNGFAEITRDYRMPVVWQEEFVLPEQDKIILEQILAQDPRPAYQQDANRLYHLDYASYSVTFRVQTDGIYVVSVQSGAANDCNK